MLLAGGKCLIYGGFDGEECDDDQCNEKDEHYQ